MILKKLPKTENPNSVKLIEKNVENKEVLPQVENPLVENQGLLIKKILIIKLLLTKKVVALLKKKK